MGPTARSLLSIVVVLALCPVVAHAAGDQQEVGAILVFPSVFVEDPPGSGHPVETALTFANQSPFPIIAHVAFIDGTSCAACEFDVPMIGSGIETLLVRYTTALEIKDLDTGNVYSCPGENGFITVNVADFDGNTLTDNVLTGHQVIIDSVSGRAVSTAAITLQGGDFGNGDREFEFNNVEYGSLPRVVAAQFLAPDPAGGAAIDATLSLFTPGFRDGLPPATECGVYRGDTDLSGPPTAVVQFGCWTQVKLTDLGSAFTYPLPGPNAESNWLQINCQVDQNNDGTFDANGGVHGAIIQSATQNARIRRQTAGPATAAPAAWGRALLQSVTTGDDVTLDLE